MKSPLTGFVEIARAAGIPVSVAESLDAFRALESVGYADRALLKDALAVVMAKSQEEKELFDRCFELYFAREEPHGIVFTNAAQHERADDADVSLAPLTRMLLAGDRAGLALAMERAGNRAGVSGIRFWTQANMYARRMLDEMGLADVRRDAASLRERGNPVADDLERAGEALRASAGAFVERQLTMSGAGAQRLDDDALKNLTLWNLDRRDVQRMRVLVRALAKRLATRYGRDRRNRRRGRLDVRRTLRRNTGHDGVPFATVWKRQKREKPRVVALCDVSGSVAPVAHFLLLLVYSLKEALSDVRAFAFSNRLIDVGPILERETIDDAIALIMRELGFGSSDYGRSLADFAAGWLDRVDRHTSVIVIGDARSNYADPRADVVKTLYERAKRVVWLNPEPPSSWGTGDSEMPRYRPYCHVARRCATLRDLERTIAALLSGG